MPENNKLITEFVFKGSFDVLKKYNAQMLAAVKLINKFTGKTDEQISAIEKDINAKDELAETSSDLNENIAENIENLEKMGEAAVKGSRGLGVMGSSVGFFIKGAKKLKDALKDDESFLRKFIGGTGKFTAGVYGMATAVTAFGAAKLNKEADFARFSKRSGESYGRLKQLDAMAKSVGAEDGALLSTLKSMQGAIGDAEIEGSEAFSRLGLTARDAAGNIKPATQLFEEAREAFQTRTGDLSLGAKQNLASQIGIGEDMVDLLLMSQKEYDELTKRNAVFLKMNNKDRDNSINATNKLNELKSRFDAAGQKMATAMAPAIIGAVDKMIQFMDKYAPAFESFAKTCSELFEQMASAVTDLIDGISDLADEWLPSIYGWLKKVWDYMAKMFGYGDDSKKDSKAPTKGDATASVMPMQPNAQMQTPAQINQNIKMEINGSDPRRTATAAVNFLQQSPNRIKSGQVSAA